MGSPAATSGGGVWPPFSSSQQAQSLIPPSIRERRAPSGCSSERGESLIPPSIRERRAPCVFSSQVGNKRKNSFEDEANACASRAGQENNLFNLEDLGDNEKAILMSAHLQMLGKFLNFCNEDRVNTMKLNVDGENNTFKDKVTSYFGEYLPSSVIDELCLLVQENSYGKCHFCALPVESLVLSVLQILLHASQNIGNKVQSPQGVSQKCSNKAPEIDHYTNVIDQSNNFVNKNPFNKIASHALGVEHYPKFTNNFVKDVLSDTCHHESKDEVPLMPMISKPKPNCFVGKLHQERTASLQGPSASRMKVASPDVYIVKETKPKGICSDLGKLADQIYNRKNVDSMVKKNTIDEAQDHKRLRQIPSSRRFEVSEIDMRYYKLLCELAHSEWSCKEAVMLFKTTVTYSSLGESVEPSGHVDTFFVSGYCRKLFDDSHPRGCLMSYATSYDINTVKNSFFGANYALKLHSAEKLCFPVYISDHWFVFIVDLRVKSFVFLDSKFDENDNFQIHARDRIIPAFKECWYEHAEVKLNLEEFQVMYPPVPKQRNSNDCGIYAVMFMELWDNNIDLTDVFNHSDIPNIRVKLGNDLFFSKHNSADKTVVQKIFKKVYPQFCNQRMVSNQG